MAIPTPYAGSYYPIYNSGENQYIPPTTSMPFGQISALFLAFAHAYPIAPGQLQSVLTLQQGQPEEPLRVPIVIQTAKTVNPDILVFISLGWGLNDWTYINTDYQASLDGKGIFHFPQSVVDLLRKYNLDGFDIDDESINGSSGDISQENFSGVVQEIRNALDVAGEQDGKTYYFSVTPAGFPDSALLTNDNIVNFDLINTQNYGGSNYSQYEGFPNAKKALFAYGIDAEGGYAPLLTKSDVQGLAGAFNWTLSADSQYAYKYTNNIAEVVGYNVLQNA